MTISVNAIDKYNFNRGMADIGSGVLDDVNGRFEMLGWAKSFMTRGRLIRTVTWQGGSMNTTTNITSDYDR